MENKKKIIAIILSISAIVVLIFSFMIKENIEEKEKEISIVTNASNFYTVNSCLYRTITYIASKDTESLLLLLNDEYKKNNNITKDNILNKLPEVEINDTFVSEKMYYTKLSGDITKYYVLGHIEQNKIFDDDVVVENEYEEIYFVVYLDSKNKIFSIEPYDGKIFVEGDSNGR